MTVILERNENEGGRGPMTRDMFWVRPFVGSLFRSALIGIAGSATQDWETQSDIIHGYRDPQMSLLKYNLRRNLYIFLLLRIELKLLRSAMPSLLDLPTELRQRILSLALPDTASICKCFSRDVLRILRVNRRLRADACELLRLWSPIHYLSKPGQLQDGARLHSYSLNNELYAPEIQRICLDLWHYGDENRMTWTCYCVHHENWTHPELIAGWSDAVPFLPLDNVTEVYLDITPAPWYKREPHTHRIIANPWLKDNRMQNFLSSHILDVTDLILKIHAHYNCRLQVKLTGTLHTKSQSYINELRRRTSVELEYVGRWITNQDARFPKIGTAVTRIVWRKGESARLAWVQDVRWGKQAKGTYAQVADEDGEQCVIDDLKALVEFKMDEGRKDMRFAPVRPLRRAFQHRAASDLGGLRTESEGEEGERFVVVRKVTEDVEDAEQVQSIGETRT